MAANNKSSTTRSQTRITAKQVIVATISVTVAVVRSDQVAGINDLYSKRSDWSRTAQLPCRQRRIVSLAANAVNVASAFVSWTYKFIKRSFQLGISIAIIFSPKVDFVSGLF
jgi:hypothetical protein